MNNAIAKAMSFLVFNAINHLNDRLFMSHKENRMNIEEATDLSNDLIKLLMNENTKQAVRNYIQWCLSDE